jgi:hypothetical protein
VSGRADPARAGEALRLRGWALAVLAGAEPGAPPPVPADAWSLFLAVEGCALPLQRAGAPRPGQGDPVGAAAMTELRRALSARGQLRRLDRLAAGVPGPVVVLKGGVAAGGAEPVEVGDVDVLVPAELAHALAARLDALGDASAPDPPPGSRGHHLGPRAEAQSVPVEVHFALPVLGDEEGVLRRSVPLEGCAVLRRPAPADHLRGVLAHAAGHHPERRGRLRDLVLAAGALRECAPNEAEGVRAWARTAPYAADVGAMLAMARALAEGRTPADPYRRTAAGAYLMAAAHAGERHSPALRELRDALNVLLGGADDRGAYLRLFVQPTTRASGLGAVAALERRAPLLGTGVRMGVRAGRFAVALARAAPLAWAARRLAESGQARRK